MSVRNSSRKENDYNLDATPIIEEKIVRMNGEVTSKRQAKGRFIGKGGFARCQEFTCLESKKLFAAKIVPKSSLIKSRAKQKLMSEIKIHRSLHHHNVVKFEHFFEDAEQVQILLELCTNQTINDLLRRRKRLTELEVQCYIIQIIAALRQLHSHRVIHRDLKLGNLFLSNNMEIKIGDFGLATKLEFDGERKRTICGTPNYIAPEILEGKNGHSYEVDTWSLGVVIQTLLVGKPPFETNDVKTTYRKIRTNTQCFPENVVISDQGKSLVSRILQTDPGKRPSMEEILAHDFFHMGNAIPKLLPASTLACPPSQAYMKQFTGVTTGLSKNSSTASTARLESTAPVNVKSNPNNANLAGTLKQDKGDERNLLHTERVRGGDFATQNSQKSTGLNPSPSVPTISQQKRSQTPRNEKDSNSSKGNDRPTTQTQTIPNSKQVKSSAHSVQDPNLKEGKGGPAVEKGPDVWVRKWVDQSSKYGLGYLLSNGTCGVFFNDSSKIILDPNGSYFEQMERRTSDRQDVVSSHTFQNQPKELQKKVTLLQHFRSQLDGENAKIDEPKNKDNKGTAVQVKKWMRTKHAIMLRLSNKIVQVNFQDKTEIILSSEARVVTQVNKQGLRSTHPLTSALESNNMEMAKRLKQTKDILTHMLSANLTGMTSRKDKDNNVNTDGTTANNINSPITQRDTITDKL